MQLNGTVRMCYRLSLRHSGIELRFLMYSVECGCHAGEWVDYCLVHMLRACCPVNLYIHTVSGFQCLKMQWWCGLLVAGSCVDTRQQ